MISCLIPVLGRSSTDDKILKTSKWRSFTVDGHQCAVFTACHFYVGHSPSMFRVAAKPTLIFCGSFESADPQKCLLSSRTFCDVNQTAMCWTRCFWLGMLTIYRTDNRWLQVVSFVVTLLIRKASALHELLPALTNCHDETVWLPDIEGLSLNSYFFVNYVHCSYIRVNSIRQCSELLYCSLWTSDSILAASWCFLLVFFIDISQFTNAEVPIYSCRPFFHAQCHGITAQQHQSYQNSTTALEPCRPRRVNAINNKLVKQAVKVFYLIQHCSESSRHSSNVMGIFSAFPHSLTFTNAFLMKLLWRRRQHCFSLVDTKVRPIIGSAGDNDAKEPLKRSKKDVLKKQLLYKLPPVTWKRGRDL